MKIIVRTLIILFAALIVVAAAVGFAQSSFAAAVAPGMPAEERGAAPVLVTTGDASSVDNTGSSLTFTVSDGTAAADVTAAGATAPSVATAASTDAAPVFEGGGSRPDHGAAGGVQGAVPLAKNLSIMALLVGVVALAPQGLSRLRRRRLQLQAR